jgi:acetyl esterase/lipase
MRLPALLISVMCLTPLVDAADADRPKVKLWPEQPPGALVDANYAEEIVYRDNDPNKPRISRVTEPALEVFLPAKDKANGTAVVVCPGGGYGVLAYDHEGIQVGRFFNELGIAAFILKYRLPSDAIMQDKAVGPLQDVQEAIRTVRRRADEWRVDPKKVGVMGFSAGGHLAASATTLYSLPVYPVADNVSARPDFSILVYPVISMQEELSHGGSRQNLLGKTPDPAREKQFSLDQQVNEHTPPTFLIHSSDDGAVRVENSLNFYLAAKKHKVPVELHIYPNGGHGYGLGVNPGSPKEWPETLKSWLRANGLL